MAKKMKHPGFQKVAQKIAAKEHIPVANADAILANAAGLACRAAKRNNTHLKRVLHRTTKRRGY